MTKREIKCALGKDSAEYLFRELGLGWWSAWKLGTPVMHCVDTRSARCDCQGWKYSKPHDKGCRHLTKAFELEGEATNVTTENSSAMVKTTDSAAAIAQIIVKGNLAMLTEQEKSQYYLAVCQACDLNPATRPFEFINMKGKLVLYALKACAEQLRKRDSVSLAVVSQEVMEGVYVVRVKATLPDGRSDEDLAAITLGTTTGEDRANLIMKAITKAKRRVTLSLCGLGMLDESEVESINQAECHVQKMVPQIAEAASIPVTATVSKPDTGSTAAAATEERRSVIYNIVEMFDKLKITDYAKHLHKSYGKSGLDDLTAEQLGDLQARLLIKAKA